MDRQTDTAAHFSMPLSLRGQRHINEIARNPIEITIKERRRQRFVHVENTGKLYINRTEKRGRCPAAYHKTRFHQEK